MIVRTSLIRMLVSRVLALGLMVVGFAVLGRLLSPEAFGHFALALAVLGIADTLVQFGLQQYLVRSDAPTREMVATAAGLSLGIAVLVSLTWLGGVWLLGGWLIPGGAARAMVPMALAILISPFVLGTEALLQRRFSFGLIAVAELLRVAVDLAVAITLALAGYGAVALGMAVLASRIAVAAILLIRGGRKNRVWPRIGNWRGFSGFGARVTAIQILPAGADLAMVSALGAILGAASLGLFNRARTIHQILDKTLFEAINPVILPALSDALRSGMAPARVYRVQLDYVAAICWPGFALIGLLAAPMVEVMLGAQWAGAVPVVRILALMGLSFPITKLSQKLFVALDETHAFLRLQVMQDVLRVPLGIAGAAISLEMFAAAYVAGTWAKAAGIVWHLRRRFGAEPLGHPQVALRAGAITLMTLAGPAAVLWADLSAAATLAAALPLAGAGWLAGAVLTRHPVIGEIRGALGDVRGILAR